MTKLYIKNLLICVIFMSVSTAVAAAIVAVLSLLGWLLTLPFIAIPTYIVGGVIGLFCALTLRGFLIEQNGCFHPEAIDGSAQYGKRSLFWITHIRNKKFIKKGAALTSYIPSFVLSSAIIALAIVFCSKIQLAGETSSYVGYAVICAIIGATALASLTYGIVGIKSLKVCKNCGTVNAFVYDEYVDFETASGFKGDVSTGGAKHHGIISWGGWMPAHTIKLTRYGDVVSRHCACCGDKSTYVANWDESKVVQPQEPTRQ